MALRFVGKLSAQSLRLRYENKLPVLGIFRGLKVEDFDEEKYKKHKHPETPKFPNQYDVSTPKGRIFDKKPFKLTLTAGRKYSWCTCGTSKNQPVCDGSHKKLEGTSLRKTTPKFRPHFFTVQETKEYWVCNCKQTGNPPFCDGTHKREDIQAAIKS